MKNIDHLLKDRYLVVRPLPVFAGVNYGEILTLEKKDDNTFYEVSTAFKKLRWWEARELDEMPEYIEFEDVEYNQILKVEKYLFCGFITKIGIKVFTDNILPATKEQYDQHLKNKE